MVEDHSSVQGVRDVVYSKSVVGLWHFMYMIYKRDI